MSAQEERAMEKNVIEIKLKPRKRIARRADGTAVIKIREEAAEAMEGLLDGVNGDVSILELASQLILCAAENCEIKLIREES